MEHVDWAATQVALRALASVEMPRRHLVVCHSADHDGVFSGAVLSLALEACGAQSVDTVGWDFGSPRVMVDGYDVVWVADLPFSVLDARHAETEPFVVWIDHHASNKREFDQVQATNPARGPDYVVHDESHSAAALCWLALVSTDLDPLVALVSRYDTWNHSGYGDEAVDVHYALMSRLNLANFGQAHQIVMDNLHPKVSRLLGGKCTVDTSYNLSVLKREGRMLLDFWRTQMDSHCGPMVGRMRWRDIDFKVLNSPIRGSITFGSDDQGYMIVWAHTPDGDVRVSLYASGTDGAHDLSEIASSFGGGGHRNAAGFRVAAAEWLHILSRTSGRDGG